MRPPTRSWIPRPAQSSAARPWRGSIRAALRSEHIHLTASNGVSIQLQGSGFTYREDATAIYDITGGTISFIQLRTPNLAVTTGGAEQAYQPDGFHGFTIAEFLRPLQRTATLCGMRWLPPFVVHGTHRITEENLARAGEAYGRMLRALHAGTLADADVASFATMNAALEAIA